MYAFYYLLLIAGVPVIAENKRYGLNIIENGFLIRETVVEHDDLQIIEVPQHADRLHIIAYLDFQSGLQMIKDVKNQRCQLSNIEQQIKTANRNILRTKFGGSELFIPNLPLDANRIGKLPIFKLERQETFQNISHLRQELREACAGLPIHWADSIEESQLDAMVQNDEILYNQTQRILIKPMNSNIRFDTKTGSCNPDPSLPPNQFVCNANCVHQKCRMTSHSCYYFITCAMNGQIGQDCLAHVLHMQGECKMCCNDPQAPCEKPTGNGFWQRCDCLIW